MFITRSQHKRNGLGERQGLGRLYGVNDVGLGITVTQTTRFDPIRLAQREAYWLNVYTEQIYQELLNQYMQSGYDVVDGLGQADVQTIINPLSTVTDRLGPVGMLVNPLTAIMNFATPILSKIPVIGGFFGGKKPRKARRHIRDEARGMAAPYAKQTALEEEQYRIAQEVVSIKGQQQTEVEKRSKEGTLFRMPEGVTAVRRGSLVMALKGPSVEMKAG